MFHKSERRGTHMHHNMPHSHGKGLNFCECFQFEKLSYYTDQVSRYGDFAVLFVCSVYVVYLFNRVSLCEQGRNFPTQMVSDSNYS